MPKLPCVSGQKVARALERLGFERRRQRGSHLVMRRGSAVCVVPMHREVDQGTLRGCCARPGSVRPSWSAHCRIPVPEAGGSYFPFPPRTQTLLWAVVILPSANAGVATSSSPSSARASSLKAAPASTTNTVPLLLER